MKRKSPPPPLHIGRTPVQAWLYGTNRHHRKVIILVDCIRTVEPCKLGGCIIRYGFNGPHNETALFNSVEEVTGLLVAHKLECGA